MEKAVKYHFIASPRGCHIQMCLGAEWVQDHIVKIIDGMTEGAGKRRGRKGEKLSVKDGIQRKHKLPFSFTFNLPSLFIARVSSRDNVEQIRKASI